jgi:hypothetical protein
VGSLYQPKIIGEYVAFGGMRIGRRNRNARRYLDVKSKRKEVYGVKLKGKAILVTGRGGPLGCETSRLPHYVGSRLTDGGQFVILTLRLAFTLRKMPGTHFC